MQLWRMACPVPLLSCPPTPIAKLPSVFNKWHACPGSCTSIVIIAAIIAIIISIIIVILIAITIVRSIATNIAIIVIIII